MDTTALHHHRLHLGTTMPTHLHLHHPDTSTVYTVIMEEVVMDLEVVAAEGVVVEAASVASAAFLHSVDEECMVVRSVQVKRLSIFQP